MSNLILLFESAVGYSLYDVHQWEEIQSNSAEFIKSAMDYKTAQSSIKIRAEHHFTTASEALDNIKDITERRCSKELIEFLGSNLPISKKKSSSAFVLGVIDKSLGKEIKSQLNIDVEVGDFISEISRVVRTHLHKFLKVDQKDILKAQLGLGHQYSRMKCMFDVNREDKPVIQSIALIDQLDKNINSYCMRIKVWFGWHFPELSKIVTDYAAYIKVLSIIENKERLLEEASEEDSELRKKIIEIVVEPEIAQRIFEAAKTSIGSDLSEIDALNLKIFCEKVEGLVNYREGLGGYLGDKMKLLAPNTSTLVGDTLAARLISHSGSLSNLCKYPASTIQILGAEKALFRALKARSGKTPKYGLLYHSQFIGKSIPKNKGKISRFLANKLAQSSRIDFLSDNRDNVYGEEFKKQVEERMKFLTDGEKPRKNTEVIEEAKNKQKDLLKNKRKLSKEEKKKKKVKKEVDSDSD